MKSNLTDDVSTDADVTSDDRSASDDHLSSRTLRPPPQTSGTMHSDHPDYPRKQFRRQSWQSLNGPWRFTFDDTGQARSPHDITDWPHTIEVPFAPECERSGIGDQAFHANCWYERSFVVEPGEGRVFLHFGAVDYMAKVWVNGKYVGSHVGGHTPFTLDISAAIANEGGANTVTVWASDDPQDLAKPRGKQDWQREPHSIWYPRTSGIWQTVWIERVPALYIDRINWTPRLEQWEIGFEAFIGDMFKPGLELHVRLTCGDQVLADDNYKLVIDEIFRRIALADPGIDDYRNELLWSPEKPTLIDAEIELISDGQVIDRVWSYTALRGITIQRDRFILNNRPYYLRLILDQGYWPDTFMTPPSQEALIKDIQLVKAAGFNGVRKHQKIEDPNFLYWADVLGLLVWEEMPSAYRFTHRSVERITREWMDAIDRDSNHPCIVTWVPFNESWGVPDLPEHEHQRHCVQALYHLTRTLDPQRPVVGNDGWESSATDILGIHDYDSDPDRIRRRYGTRLSVPDLLKWSRPGGRLLTLEGHPHEEHPIVLSEFGGIAFRDNRHKEARDIWGYSVSRSGQDLQQRYTLLLDAVNAIDVFCGFCYTQFTDTFQEANGLFYADRTPKFPIEAMNRATCGRHDLAIEVVSTTGSTTATPGEKTQRPPPNVTNREIDAPTV